MSGLINKTQSSLSSSQDLKSFMVVGGFGNSGTRNCLGGFAPNKLEGFESSFVLFSDKEDKAKGTGGFLSKLELIFSTKACAKIILSNLGMSNGDAPIHGIAQTIVNNGIRAILGHSFGGTAAVHTSGFLAQLNNPLSIVISEGSPYSPQSIIKSRASDAEKLLVTENVMKEANLAWDLEDATKVTLQKGTKVIVARRVGDVTVPEKEQLYTKLKESQRIFPHVSQEYHGNLTLISIKLDPKKEEHYSKERTQTLIGNKILGMFEVKASTNLTKFNTRFNDAFAKLPSKLVYNPHHWPLEDFIIEEEYVGSQNTFKSVLNTKVCNFKERVLAEFKDVKPNQLNSGAELLVDITYPPARVEDKFECSKGEFYGYYIEKMVKLIIKQLQKDGFKLKDGAKNISSTEWGIEWERSVGM